ncbi:hypothetical protein FB563_3455 [Streptomyces puniciscabiei]|uniref:Uncharacterized protein n=1 Tax=Streptomyces puniciscabiei TaxID=164348 RepID=A0A542UH80_9ACTN|nr:hypothetical protein [Streptomyces puniciscabiei]TQK98429.1 hypothetical protein FB563_3455 [Streptomyces puniciscabiei]
MSKEFIAGNARRIVAAVGAALTIVVSPVFAGSAFAAGSGDKASVSVGIQAHVNGWQLESMDVNGWQ